MGERHAMAEERILEVSKRWVNRVCLACLGRHGQTQTVEVFEAADGRISTRLSLLEGCPDCGSPDTVPDILPGVTPARLRFEWEKTARFRARN